MDDPDPDFIEPELLRHAVPVLARFRMTPSLVLAPGLLLFVGLSSCTAPRTNEVPVAAQEPPSARLMRESVVIDTLSNLRSADEMLGYLRNGLPERDLEYVGFDGVPASQRIDQVVSAVMDERSTPGSREAQRRLTDSLKIYFAAMREVAVRRSAGAASCLPTVR